MSDEEKILLTDRWHFIDALESIGLLFVVLNHSTTYQYSWNESGKILFCFRYCLRTILSTCVPLFFFANGYLLLNRPFDLKKHIVKSIKMVILTGIWGIIGLLVVMPIEGQFFTPKEFVVNLWRWQPIGWINHLWYMGALFCIYAFFPLLKYVFDNQKKLFYYFTIIAIIFTFGSTFITYSGSVIVDIFFDKTFVSHDNIFNMFNPFRGIYGYSFAYFCVGGLVHSKENAIRDAKHRVLISNLCILVSCLCLFGLGIFFSNAQGAMWDVVWNGYDTLFTFINVLCIYALCLCYKGSISIIKLISCNTLGVYFIHNIAIRFTKGFVLEIPALTTVIGNLVYAILIILICLIITQIMKKIPILKYLFKL